MPGPTPSRTRVTQLGVEVLGPRTGTAHIHVTQLGAEALGAFSAGHIRVTQLGHEVLVALQGSGGNVRVTQLGYEFLGKQTIPPPANGHIRVNQLGLEVMGKLFTTWPAGDTLGAEYYIGPGFTGKYVTEKQPSTYHPQADPAQALVALGNLIGVGVNIYAATISNVPLDGVTTVQATFPEGTFQQDCFFVVGVYVPASGDSTPVVVQALINPNQVTEQGFQITGFLLAGSTAASTGTFTYAAVGI